MSQEKKAPIAAVLLMAGDGNRFGNKAPKQFLDLDGKKVYQHALATFKNSNLFEEILLVVKREWIEIIQQEVDSFIRVIEGGKTRQESSFKAIQALDPKIEYVLIHDAVRPFVSEAILQENVKKAKLYGAVDTCIKSTDTIVFAPQESFIETIGSRSHFFQGQTPQTFRKDWIEKAHEKALKDQIFNATDDCSLVLRLGHLIQITEGSRDNFKITFDFDLEIARAFLAHQTQTKREKNEILI